MIGLEEAPQVPRTYCRPGPGEKSLAAIASNCRESGRATADVVNRIASHRKLARGGLWLVGFSAEKYGAQRDPVATTLVAPMPGRGSSFTGVVEGRNHHGFQCKDGVQEVSFVTDSLSPNRQRVS